MDKRYVVTAGYDIVYEPRSLHYLAHNTENIIMSGGLLPLGKEIVLPYVFLLLQIIRQPIGLSQ